MLQLVLGPEPYLLDQVLEVQTLRCYFHEPGFELGSVASDYRRQEQVRTD